MAITPIPSYLAIRPCNFRLHSAFQESYDWFNRRKPASSEFRGRTIKLNATNIAPFYRTLNGDHCRIIEYPREVQDAFVPYYFYQLVHHCSVAVGYTDKDTDGKRLQVKKNRDRLHFRNMIPVDDVPAIKRAEADYVVVHIDVLAEIKRQRRGVRGDAATRRVLDILKDAFGEAAYEDRWIAAFRVR